MAALVGHDARQYSWWWVSHISPKNSKWLQENLNDMDTKVKAMIKLLNEDADSFARRAEMYYKKRPELMKLVEEFYRAYRALAERYDQATGALRQAHRTISEAFPNQMPSISDELPSPAQEAEPHTPDMSTFTRAPFDSDDLQKDGVGVSPQNFTTKRNGTHPEQTSSLPIRKGLKKFNDLPLSSENAPRAVFDGKVRKGLTFESSDVKGKEDINNDLVSLQEEISRLLAESQNMKQQMLSESERATKTESEIQSLKNTVLQLNSEKDASFLQYNQSTKRLSALESELSKAQAELKILTNEMATEVQKLNCAEARNIEMLSELETLDQKVKMQQQEFEQKNKELDSFHSSFKEEHEKRLQAESALLSEAKERAQSQEEVQRLSAEIKMLNEKLNELKQTKVDLRDVVCELKKEVNSLTEQNHSSELLIQELHNEIISLIDSKNDLQSEIQNLKSTILQLNTQKDAALLQHQMSVERVSVLEPLLLKLQSERDEVEQKIQMLLQDLEQTREEIDSVQALLQDECCKRTQTEAALLMTESMHSMSEGEVKNLTEDLERLSKKLSELENDKFDLGNTSRELKNTILDLRSENDEALLQQQRSLEKVSHLELQLSETQFEMEKSKQKIQLLELEIAQSESVDSLKVSLKDEAEKRVQAEKSVLSLENMYSESQEEISRLHLEIEKLNGKLNGLESSSSELKNTILFLHAEKDAALVQNQQSSVKVSDLESEVSILQAELEKVKGKVEILEQELKHKIEEVDSLQISLQDEAQKRIDGEAALASMTNLHSDSQEKVWRLALEINKLTGKLSEVGNSKIDLQNVLSKRMEDISILCEQNLSIELMVKDLRCELDELKELNSKLEAEVGFHLGEKELLQRDFSCQREEKENLEGLRLALADEMNTLKGNAETKQKLIEELQIMNLKLKEACAKSEVEKALLSEKFQEVEKLSEEYSLLENSLSDANAEMDALREKIKALQASESSLKDAVSSHAFEKAALTSELETIGRSFADISEKNSILNISLSNMKTEIEELRTKLKDSEETCQVHISNNSALSAEKNSMFSQLESITLLMKALEGKHDDLEEMHSSLSIEKNLAYDQVRGLQDQLRIKNEEYESVLESHQMEVKDLEEQICSLQEKTHNMDEMLEHEEQNIMSASISVVILANSLVDAINNNVFLFSKCQKYADANHTTEMLLLQLKDEARYHEEERRTLLMHTDKLREGISQHMKVLNIHKDLGPANLAQDEILLRTVSDETFNILKLKEESEDANKLMYTELMVIATVLLEVGTELRDLQLQKCALEKEVKSGVEEFVSLQNKNQESLECNAQLRQWLKEGSEREGLLKTEALVLKDKLSCLSRSYQTSRDEISSLAQINESLSKEHQSLIEKYNALEDENSTKLAEIMRLELLYLFFRGHNNEVASALASLTDELALLTLNMDKLDCELKVSRKRAMALELENNHLKEYFVLSEFDLNMSRSMCQESVNELESVTAQLIQKDDELLEAEEKVQLFQEKNRELCGVVGALQVAIEGAKVVKGELEKKITTLNEEGTTKDDEILLLRRTNEMFLEEVNILKGMEDSLTSAQLFLLKEVEQHERDCAVLMGNAITSSVNAAVFEEKALKLMVEGKAMEISAMDQKVLLMKEISSRDAHILDLHQKVTGIQEENADLKAELSSHLTLVESLSDHVNVLEQDTLSLSKTYSTKGKEEAVRVPCLQEGNHAPDSYYAERARELQQLIGRMEALRLVILNVKDHQDHESTECAAMLAAANIEIQELKARNGNGEGSKGKQVQMMKDIELDKISACPPYGTGTALYPRGNGANAQLDDEMLQLWEAAERNCKSQTATSSSSEHDIQAVEEVKSEYPSSELASGRDLEMNKLETSMASVEPHEVWSKNVLERLTSDAQRLWSIQTSIEELKRKIGDPSKGKSPMNSEYNSVSTQLLETEGYVLEQINFNSKMTKNAENYPAPSDSMNAKRKGYSNRSKILEQAQKGSENVARLELELQKIQYVLLKLEEEHEYKRLKVSDKRTRVLLRDYLYGRKDNRGGRRQKKKRAPFCGCVQSRTEA